MQVHKTVKLMISENSQPISSTNSETTQKESSRKIASKRIRTGIIPPSPPADFQTRLIKGYCNRQENKEKLQARQAKEEEKLQARQAKQEEKLQARQAKEEEKLQARQAKQEEKLQARQAKQEKAEHKPCKCNCTIF